MEAQKLGGSDMLILAASRVFLMTSGELPGVMFDKKILIIEYNSEKTTLGGSWGLLGAILKPLLGRLGFSWGCLGGSWGGLGVVGECRRGMSKQRFLTYRVFSGFGRFVDGFENRLLPSGAFR